jgi:hypothetical protein
MQPLCDAVERLRAVAERLDALLSKKGHDRPVSMPLAAAGIRRAVGEILVECEEIAQFCAYEGSIRS